MCRRVSVELLLFVTCKRSPMAPPSLQSMPLTLANSFNEYDEQPISLASSRHRFCSSVFFSASCFSNSNLRCFSVCSFCETIVLLAVLGDVFGASLSLNFMVATGDGSGRSAFWSMFGVRVLLRIVFPSATHEAGPFANRMGKKTTKMHTKKWKIKTESVKRTFNTMDKAMGIRA